MSTWKKRPKKADNASRREREQNEFRVRNLKEIFAAHDRDKNGAISSDELKPLVKSLGFANNEEQIDGVVEEMLCNSGNPGEMSFDEFVTFVGHAQGLKDLDVKQVWPLFDPDQSGAISQDEMAAVMDQCGIKLDEAQMAAMWQLGDPNQDGKITYDEFAKAASTPVWKKAITLLSVKQHFVSKLVAMSDKHTRWRQLHEERSEGDWAVDTTKLIVRSSLRENELVKNSIVRFWGALEGLRNAPGVVEQPLFFAYFMKIAQYVLEDEFDPTSHRSYAAEEWERQGQIYAKKEGGEATADRIDFDVFFDSMFELIDYEVAGHAQEKIEPSTYAGFMDGVVNQLLVETTYGRRKRIGKKNLTEKDKITRSWEWRDKEFAEVGAEGWDSVDREAEAELVAREATEKEQAQKRKERGRRLSVDYLVRKGSDPLAVFKKLDVNRDGELSMDELCIGLSDFGLSDQEIEQLVFCLDSNGDGVVDSHEFVRSFDKFQNATRARKPVGRSQSNVSFEAPRENRTVVSKSQSLCDAASNQVRTLLNHPKMFLQMEGPYSNAKTAPSQKNNLLERSRS
eukprot:TRINITY_DN49707_c0_g1_i3.p1 TRINITY_DN49707_c0_g1~~TRINITY_DN49707_c0_g1_i3.p1  ORF type:complete len:568 (-),score=180.99 TRINITY_DN49707_c0_g1_i3:306-2009(-)